MLDDNNRLEQLNLIWSESGVFEMAAAVLNEFWAQPQPQLEEQIALYMLWDTLMVEYILKVIYPSHYRSRDLWPHWRWLDPKFTIELSFWIQYKSSRITRINIGQFLESLT